MYIYVVQLYDSRTSTLNPCVTSFCTEKEAEDYVNKKNKERKYNTILYGYRACWLNGTIK